MSKIITSYRGCSIINKGIYYDAIMDLLAGGVSSKIGRNRGSQDCLKRDSGGASFNLRL